MCIHSTHWGCKSLQVSTINVSIYSQITESQRRRGWYLLSLLLTGQKEMFKGVVGSPHKAPLLSQRKIHPVNRAASTGTGVLTQPWTSPAVPHSRACSDPGLIITAHLIIPGQVLRCPFVPCTMLSANYTAALVSVH